ncbi:MAG: diguanylate cyclase [Burkholderiaceae bacterium]|nr:diguanylate cyclase [Burkholderiaceae bacterium]
MSSSAPAAERQGPASVPPADEQPIRVLLVDDQPIIVEAVRFMLADDEAIEFHACTDAHAARQVALDVLPTVILQDLVMDDVDGLDLVRCYRADPQLHDVPVVVLSAHEEAENKVNAFAVGANDYVVKLPSPLELVARVRYHSAAYVNGRARVAAFNALLESQKALEQANRELRESAYTDALTGLRNRRFFHEWQEQQVGSGSEFRVDGVPPLMLALMDVDHFKNVNDTLGHHAGDRVLAEVAARLRACVRADDVVVRWGGEEFLYVGIGLRGDALTLQAQRILDAIGGAPVPLGTEKDPGRSLRVTVSMGWTPWPWSAAMRGSVLGIERSLALADTAIYLAKRGGRNRAFGVLPGSGAEAMHDWYGGDDAPQALKLLDGSAVRLVEQLGPSAAAAHGGPDPSALSGLRRA